MLQETLGLSVAIRAGLDGPMLKEYDSEPSRMKMSMEAVSGIPICPEIIIHDNFKWHDADGLHVAIRYGSPHYQLEGRSFRSSFYPFRNVPLVTTQRLPESENSNSF